jgi:hypothetical protein
MTCRPSVRIALVLALAVGPLAACGGSGTPIEQAEASSTVSGGSAPSSSERPSVGATTENAPADGAQPAQTTTQGPPEREPDPVPASPAPGSPPAPVPQPPAPVPQPPAPVPQPPAPAPPPPAPGPGPQPPAPKPPAAPGAPYDIDAFDQIQGTTLITLDREVADRCGSPTGAPNCLTVHETPVTAPQDLRDACRLPTFQYVPEAKNAADGTRKLQRGTVIEVQVECPQPLTSVVGSTIATVENEVSERCGSGDGATCSLVVSPAVPDGVDHATCTVASLSYTPEPVAAGALGNVMDVGTVVSVEPACPAPPP